MPYPGDPELRKDRAELRKDRALSLWVSCFAGGNLPPRTHLALKGLGVPRAVVWGFSQLTHGLNKPTCFSFSFAVWEHKL